VSTDPVVLETGITPWKGALKVSAFTQGIYVTVMGMGMVFASLGVLMLIIIALQWVLQERPSPTFPRRRPLSPALAGAGSPLPLAATAAAPAQETASASALSVEESVPEEIVAAIVAALITLQQQEQDARPPQTTVVTFAPNSGAWRALGRLS